MRLKRGGQPEASAQVEGPQVKFICRKGLRISPQGIQAALASTVYKKNLPYLC
jgi:hypothetical protein